MILSTSGVFLASLVGSVHCAGMCGGFVCLYTQGAESPNRMHHAWYNGGRLLSYLSLGALAGALGAQVTRLGVLVGVSRAAALVAAVLMVGWALSTIAARQGVVLSRVQAPEAWQRAIGSLLRRLRHIPSSQRALATGLLTTLLPCGWLYVFVAAAGGTGEVPTAMLTMFVFWLGTVPALVAVGVGAQRVLAPLRQRLPVLSAAVVLVIGLLTVASHLSGSALSGVQHVH